MKEFTNTADSEPLGLKVFAIPAEIPWLELNQRYFAFAMNLPPPLDALARDRHLFRGKGESLKFDSLAELHPLVTCLPWLFDEAFPAASQTDVLAIAEAGVLLFTGMLLQDAFQDNQLSKHSGIPLLHSQLTSTAVQKFHILFGSGSPLWTYFDKYFAEYNQALELEKKHWGKLQPYPVERMYRIGSGKVALLKTVIAALAIKGDGESQIQNLETAIDSLAAAMQLGDDIADWKEDYQCQNFTFPLTSVIPVEYWPNPRLSVEEIARRFESSFILEKLIVQVIEWFQIALNVVAELHCPHWVGFVESCLGMTRDYQESIVARKLLKTLKSHPAFAIPGEQK